MFFIQVCSSADESHHVQRVLVRTRARCRHVRWHHTDFYRLSGNQRTLLRTFKRLRQARIPCWVLHCTEKPLADLAFTEHLLSSLMPVQEEPTC